MRSRFDDAILETLRSRPGRGGIRLAYNQADRLLRLLAAASTAAHENRQLRLRVAELERQVVRLERARDEEHGRAITLEMRSRGLSA